VQSEQRGRPAQRERGGGDEVAVAHPERVAEQQLAQARGGLGREREQRPQAEGAGDHHCRSGVGTDALVTRGERDDRRRDRDPADPAQQQRRPRERREHQAREHPVGERLGGVAEPEAGYPEAETAARRPEQRDLEQCAAVDARSPGIDQEVQGVHQCSWCWTVMARSGAPSSSITTISLP
jgi:hypothetical protein